MKLLLSTAAAAMLLAAAQPALAANPPASGRVCLSTYDIQSMEPNRMGTSINLTMRNGQVWHNDLKGRCPGLIYNGFTWNIHGATQQVCDNQESLRVIRSGEVCLLGKFTEVERPHHGG